jgi:hypothetical protein
MGDLAFVVSLRATRSQGVVISLPPPLDCFGTIASGNDERDVSAESNDHVPRFGGLSIYAPIY